MLTRLITGTARQQLAWIGSTYLISDQVSQWCQDIVARADLPDRPLTEISLADIMAECEGMVHSPGDDWSLSVQRFRERGWLGKLQELRVMIAKRAPPHKVRVNVKRFGALSDGNLQVEVKSVYEIDLVFKTVTFRFFGSYTPDADLSEATCSSEEW